MHNMTRNEAVEAIAKIVQDCTPERRILVARLAIHKIATDHLRGFSHADKAAELQRMVIDLHRAHDGL